MLYVRSVFEPILDNFFFYRKIVITVFNLIICKYYRVSYRSIVEKESRFWSNEKNINFSDVQNDKQTDLNGIAQQ